MSSLQTIALMLCAIASALPAHGQAQPEPLMAEELLELMLSQCRAGQAAQARRLAQDIRDQLPTTPAIDALLAPVLDGACTPAAPKPLRELHLSMGWDDNVNLGLLASTVTFASPGQPITFALEDSYKPVRSAYLGATGLLQTQTASGWTVQAQFGARQLLDYSPLNSLGVQLTGRRELQALETPGQLTLGWAETWLGGRHFRSAPSVAWQSQPSGGQQGWVFNVGAQHHDYSTTTFDARQLLAGITHLSRPDAHTQLSWGAGWLHDQALGPRAGGNRQGINLQLGWQHAWLGGVWHAQWGRQQWASAQHFLPGLMDYRRNNRTTTALVGYQRPLRSGAVAYVEYQSRNSHDNVPLYAYRSNQLGLGWMLRWP
ncbi:MAG: hypothetical protein ACKOFG_09375 [Limnohabitans sp.]